MKISNTNSVFLSSLKPLAFLTVILLSYPVFSFSQSSNQQLVINNKRSYSEALYVITDRDIYISGEQVLLKLYCLNTLNETPSAISRVAYVSLLDNLNNPVVQVKIGIDGFTGSGQLILPDTIKTGNYYLASCTHWMQNFSPELFSYRCITVVNPFQDIEKLRVSDPFSVPDTVIFFPESGSIIPDAEVMVGFRCLDKNRDPVEVTGFIADSSNTVMCQVQSDKNGYGFFTVNPTHNNELYLAVTRENEPVIKFSLPHVAETGITFSVTNDPDRGLFTIRILKSAEFNATHEDFFLVYSPVTLSPFSRKLNPLRENEIVLNQNSLPAGLASIRIEDENGRIYAERWIYNDKADHLYYNVRVDTAGHHVRDRVRIDITASDSEGRPVASDVLVSIAKSFSLNEAGNNQVSDLQMTGVVPLKNINGLSDINDRLIFFRSGSDLTRKTNDQMTSMYLPEPDGHLISGIIIRTTSGEPLRNEDIVLSFVGKTALCRFTRTDDLGHFNFMANEHGTREIVIQPLSPDVDDYYVELDDPFPETFSKIHPQPFIIDTTILGDINNAIISMQVRRVYDPFITGNSNSGDDRGVPDFYGKPDNTTQMSTFIELSSLKETIKEIVPGALTTTKKGRTSINTIFRFQDQIFIKNPLVLVDGVPVFDHEKALSIKVSEIEKIDVVSSEYYISNIALEGIIDITTYKGNLSIPFDKPVFRQEFETLQQRLSFVSPDYSTPSLRDSHIPDFRNTLYWNPNVTTNSQGKATVEFYTSDEPGAYTIIVEGITPEGAKGKSVASFLVTR